MLSAHFLMNALNGLQIRIDKDSGKAGLYCSQLSSILNYYMKYANQPTVSLQQELDLLKQYFSLLKDMYPNNLSLEINICPSIQKRLQDYRITAMSIQLAVENAAKHNMSTRGNCLLIQITISKKEVSVTNNKSHFKKINLHNPSTGFGLAYLKNKTLNACQRNIEIEETKNIYSIRFPITQSNPDEYSFNRRQSTIGKGIGREAAAV